MVSTLSPAIPRSHETLRAALTQATLLAFHRRIIPIRFGASHRYEAVERGMRWEVEGPRCRPLAIQTRDGWKRPVPCEEWPCPHFGAVLLPHGYRAGENRGPSLAMQSFDEPCEPSHFNHACFFCWYDRPHTFGEHAAEIAYYQGRVITTYAEAHNPWVSHVDEGLEALESHRMAARLAISAIGAA